MEYALLLMGRSGDPDCGGTGGADPSADIDEAIACVKKRIAKTGIPFARPGPDELIDRLPESCAS